MLALISNPTVVLMLESAFNRRECWRVLLTGGGFRVLILHPHALEIYGDIDAGRIMHQISMAKILIETWLALRNVLKLDRYTG